MGEKKEGKREGETIESTSAKVHQGREACYRGECQ
jgi:hypothetical protein